MEKSKIQDGQIDSDEYLAFDYLTLEPNYLHQQEYTDFPSPSLMKDVGESGKCRGPKALKADLGITKTNVVDTQKTQDKKTHQTKKTGESGRRRRPIALKADLGNTKTNVADTQKTQGKKTRQTKKAGELDGRRRPIALKSGLEIPKSNVPNKKKTQGKKTGHSTKAIEPRIKKKASAQANTRAATQTFPDTPVPVRSPMGSPSVNFSELCFSWVQKRRRLLLIVGLSFISGILFHSWFVPDETAAPSQFTDSGKAAQQSVRARTDNEPQPVPNPGNVSNTNAQSSHANNRYPPEQRGYRNPSYDSTWPQQHPSSPYPNYGWNDYGHQTTPRTPATAPWRDPGGQATPDYQMPTRQKYVPWSYNFQQYPPE